MLPGPEHGEETAFQAAQPQQTGAPEVAVQGGELPDEVRVVEEAGHRALGQRVQRAVVQREDLGDQDLGPPREGRVAAEEQDVVTDGHEVPAQAVTLGAYAVGAREGQLARTEFLDPCLVEDLGTPGQLARLRDKTVAQHRVRVLVDSRAHPVPLLVPWWIRVRCR
jgi:hypothetical protein